MTRKAVPLVVYIVDDDDAVRNGFARLIRSAGLDARPFGSAHEFLAGVRDQPLACILLDISLPRLSGLEVLERLRADTRTELLPVVILTSSDEQKDRLKSYENGCNSFVQKPVDFADFAETVARLGVYWLATNEPPPERAMPR